MGRSDSNLYVKKNVTWIHSSLRSVAIGLLYLRLLEEHRTKKVYSSFSDVISWRILCANDRKWLERDVEQTGWELECMVVVINKVYPLILLYEARLFIFSSKPQMLHLIKKLLLLFPVKTLDDTSKPLQPCIHGQHKHLQKTKYGLIYGGKLIWMDILRVWSFSKWEFTISLKLFFLAIVFYSRA